MNADEAFAFANIVAAIDDAGGDVRDVEIDTRSVIRPETVFDRERPTERVFTLEVTVEHDTELEHPEESDDGFQPWRDLHGNAGDGR